MLQVLVISIILVGLAVAGIAIKMFMKKGAEFQKSCGSVDPTSGQRVACTCGKPEEERCENKDSHGHRHDEVEYEEITAH
jgi:hypothetical protein